MKKVYKLEDLDCANCAAKMERCIRQIEGVQGATVSFMAQRLTIEANEEDMDRVVREAAKVCKRIEPDCSIVM